MSEGFTRKKVESLTLGEKLKKLRGDFRMSLTEISKATRIQVKYLEHLENGEYEKLPADVYVRGFLKSYALYLNIDEGVFMKLYERERHIQENLHQKPKEQPVHKKHINIASLVITPQSIVITFVVLLVLGAFIYVFREFQTFALVPRLVILSPMNGTVVDTDTAVIQGKTDKGARVSINDQSIFVDGEGNFSSTLPLQSGINTLTVMAVDRFEKQKVEVLVIESSHIQPIPEAVPVSLDMESQMFRVEVSVRENPAQVMIEVDDEKVFDGVLRRDTPQSVISKERVTVFSDKPSQTFIRWNDAEEESLSIEKKIEDAVVFTPLGRQL